MQNDPVKTVCATMFIVSVIQHIKIGDLSMSQSGAALGDVPPDDMGVDPEYELPDGTDIGDTSTLSRADERSLVRDSTAGFAGMISCQSVTGPCANQSLSRLGCISSASHLCFVRESSRRGRQEKHDRRKARGKRSKVDQEHDGCHLPTSFRFHV